MWMKRTNEKILLTMIIFLLTLNGCGLQEETVEEISLEEAEVSKEEPEEEDKTEIVVYICGSVQNPGVYELLPGARVYEAVEAAGGLLDEAAVDQLNQAALLEDGQQITVLSKEEAQNQAVEVAEAEEGVVNINSAGKEELMTLTGIGEMKAEAILQYRKEHGSFSSVDELMSVDGIKESTFSKVKDKIRI